MASQTLPTLQEFSHRFYSVDIARLPNRIRKCKLCARNLSNSGTTERPVALHGLDIFGEQCLKKHLAKHGHCPCCNLQVCQRQDRAELFRDLPFQQVSRNDTMVLKDDVDNINLIGEIRMDEMESHICGDYKGSERNRDEWRKMADLRAELFNEGYFDVNLADYDGYRRDLMDRLNFIPPKPRLVKADHIIPHFEEQWDHLFFGPWMKDHTDSSADDPIRLTAATHPLSAELRQSLIKTLQDADGAMMSARQLEARLKADFAGSELYRTLNRLRDMDEYPQGFFIYQGHLMEMILRRFLAMEDHMEDPMKLPRGWLTRFPVSR